MQCEDDTRCGRFGGKRLHRDRRRREIASRIKESDLSRALDNAWGRRIATDLPTERRALFAPRGLHVAEIEVHTEIVGLNGRQDRLTEARQGTLGTLDFRQNSRQDPEHGRIELACTFAAHHLYRLRGRQLALARS